MVIGLALLLLGAGGWTARQMPIDVFPDLTAPTVTILTEGHGMAPGGDGIARDVSDRERHQRRLRRAPRPVGHRRRHRRRLGRVRLGHRHLHGAAARLGEAGARQRHAAAAGRAAGAGARVVDHGRDPVLRDLVRTRRSADAAHHRRHDRAPTAAGGARRVAGDADRRRGAAVPGDRASRCAARQQRVADRAARRRFAAPVRTRRPASTPKARRSTSLEAVGRARTPEEIGETVVALRGDRSVLVRNVADVREGGGVQARRRLAQRQAGGHRRRAEAARRQHDRGDRAARPRARHAAAASCRPA